MGNVQNMATTICAKCGQAINEDAAYCSNCGSPVSGRLRATHPEASHSHAPDAPIAQWSRPALSSIPTAITLRLASGKTYTLRGKNRFVVGRRAIEYPLRNYPPPDVDLDPDDGYELGVSRQHLCIYLRPDGAFVEDLESLSDTVLTGYRPEGSPLAGFRLGSKQLYPLRDGDELKLGGIVMSVQFHYD